MSSVEFSFAQPWLLLLLGLLPALGLAGLLVSRRQQRAAQTLTGPRLTKAPRGRGRLLWRMLALGLLIVGAAGPCGGRDPDAPRPSGRDVLVVLDISRSMLAEDSPPLSRLTRAKRELQALVDAIEQRGGTRIGLIGFAGKAKLLCPLTEDYEHFRFALESAHPDLLGPAERIIFREDGAGLGTSLQAALDLAVVNLDADARGFHEILLISDGDDLAGDWQAAAQRCIAAHAAVHVFGVGDPARDAPIPIGANEFLQIEAKPEQREKVTTRRHDDILHAIAEQTRGQHMSEEDAGQPLVTWFVDKVAPLQVRERTDDLRPVAVQRSGWFFAAALVLLALDLLLAHWRRARAGNVRFVPTGSTSQASADVVG